MKSTVTATSRNVLSLVLTLLADSFPDARLHLDPLAALLGPFAAAAMNALEAAWFSLCLAGALMLARR